MTSESPRSPDSFPLWLALSAAAVIGAALFSATRAKPPVLFLLGFGAVIGLVLRFLATSLSVARNWRTIVLAALLAGCGAILSFVPSYRREATLWDAARSEQPSDPLAAALLRQAAQDDPAGGVPPFTIQTYLSRRYPTWLSPWPEVLFSAEWLGCVLVTGLCVGLQPFAGRPSETEL
jgi:hypothetical protein